MEGVDTKLVVLEEVAIMEGFPCLMTGIATFSLMNSHTLLFLPNLHSHLSQMDWTTDIPTVCSMKTQETRVMLLHLSLMVHRAVLGHHHSSLQCKALSTSSSHLSEGHSRSLHSCNLLLETL